jgi:hypothetical protein
MKCIVQNTEYTTGIYIGQLTFKFTFDHLPCGMNVYSLKTFDQYLISCDSQKKNKMFLFLYFVAISGN